MPDLAVSGAMLWCSAGTVPAKVQRRRSLDIGSRGAAGVVTDTGASVDGDLWSPLRHQFLGDARLPYSFAEWEAALAPRAGVVQKTVSDTVRSIFRLALSYYLGARLKVNTGETEKNALALLSRASLTSVFTKAGLAPVLVDFTSPAGLARAQSRFADLFIKQLSRYENDITAAVDDAAQKESYQKYADTEVLSGIPVVELMRRLVKDEEKKGISHIAPGITLTKPDPLSISKQLEPVRPERGGSQFEYRTLSAGNWRGKFLEIGSQMFDLNTRHLDPQARKTLKERAGW